VGDICRSWLGQVTASWISSIKIKQFVDRFIAMLKEASRFGVTAVIQPLSARATATATAIISSCQARQAAGSSRLPAVPSCSASELLLPLPLPRRCCCCCSEEAASLTAAASGPQGLGAPSGSVRGDGMPDRMPGGGAAATTTRSKD
jgi:hypothetical protein